MVAEEADDLWLAYNLISEGDSVLSVTEIWDLVALDVLHQASDPTTSADLAVVLIQEGLAHMLLVGKRVTTTCSRVETSIPRKHGPAIAGYDKALNKFFDNVLLAFLKHVDFNIVRCAVIASPGFTKDQFHRHFMLEAERRSLRSIIENKSRMILVHSTSGYNLLNMLYIDYGVIGWNSDIPTRQRYVNLVDSVKNSGCSVHILLSEVLNWHCLLVSRRYFVFLRQTWKT